MIERNIDHLTRQLDIIPLDTLTKEITVIGAGAIGSFVVLSLAKMGFRNITVWDFDKVSVENMNCQWFRFGDIGSKKVEALKDLIFDFTQIRIRSIDERWAFESVTPLGGIVISAVDSMKVREEIWKYAKCNPRIKWLIDPRMASEYALSFVMNPHDPKDQESYEKTLYSDEDAVQEPCTARSTMYTATMIAGHVAKIVKDIVTDKKYARVTHWDIAENDQQTWRKQ